MLKAGSRPHLKPAPLIEQISNALNAEQRKKFLSFALLVRARPNRIYVGLA